MSILSPDHGTSMFGPGLGATPGRYTRLLDNTLLLLAARAAAGSSGPWHAWQARCLTLARGLEDALATFQPPLQADLCARLMRSHACLLDSAATGESACAGLTEQTPPLPTQADACVRVLADLTRVAAAPDATPDEAHWLLCLLQAGLFAGHIQADEACRRLSRWWCERRQNPDMVSSDSDVSPRAGILLVAGPDALRLFAPEARTRVEEGLPRRWAHGLTWLCCETPAALVEHLQQAWRAGTDCAVLLPLCPGGADESRLRQDWAGWRHAIAAMPAMDTRPVPTYGVLYASAGLAGTDGLTLHAPDPAGPAGVASVSEACQALRDQVLSVRAGAALLHQRLLLSVLDWAQDSALLGALTGLANTPPLFLAGLTLQETATPVGPQPAWARWLTTHTGLLLPAWRGEAPPPPLPAVVATAWRPVVAPPLMPEQRVMPVSPAMMSPPVRPVLEPPPAPPSRRWLAWLAVALLSVAAVGVGGKVWRAEVLAGRARAALTTYEHVPPAWIQARCGAWVDLQEHHDAIVTQTAAGGLSSWWLARRGAAAWMPRIETALANYQTSPTIFRLDGAVSFDSGSARLNATEVRPQLAPVAALIAANPGWEVEIIGHTDATGRPDDNETLSLARAAAVREALAHLSGVDISRFKVFGHGATEALADNVSVAGRARNRRVEIRVLPVAGLDPRCLRSAVDSPAQR